MEVEDGSIVTANMCAIVEDKMQADDETTVSQLHQCLMDDQHGCGHPWAQFSGEFKPLHVACT